MPMELESSQEMLGPKGMIRKRELVRLIIQSLYSLGYKKSAYCLELESGVSYTSVEYKLLETQILGGNWDDCIDYFNSVEGFTDDARASALFLVLKQCFLEYLRSGDDSLVLDVLREQVSGLQLSREKVNKLSCTIFSSNEEELGKIDGDDIRGLRKGLLSELENLLPPPITLPERRLEHLVDTVVMSQIDSCVYHNISGPVSIYGDHCCGRNQIPTETTQILTNHNNEVWFVQFSSSGEYLASSSSDCTAIIWKVMEDCKVSVHHILRSHQNPVSFVAWSPDDTKLLTCGNMEVIKLWDVETGTCKHTFEDHGFVVSSCAWFPDSKRFVCGSSDPVKGIHMWDCEGNEIKAWRGSRIPKVLDLAITQDGETLISLMKEKEIRILNLVTNAERLISEEHPVTSLTISGDGKFFIVNLNSQEIHLWDVAGKWKKPVKYTGHVQNKYVIRSCFGGLNSRFIASGSENSQVYIWSRQGSKPIEVLSGHSMTVNCVTWNPRKPWMLASASDDHTIRIWGPK